MDERGRPPYRWAGLALVIVLIAIAAVLSGQFRGAFTSWTVLTLRAERAGLVMEPGAKVTLNGVEIGRVSEVRAVSDDGRTGAELILQVHPRYVQLLPANVIANITATTVFGNKYVSLRSPQHPTAERISGSTPIRVTSVSTEFNTLFETMLSISERVDPVRLNAMLSALAEALTGLGDRFGQSLIDGNSILDELNPRIPELGREARQLTALANVYTSASPDLWDGLDAATTTAATLSGRRTELSAALLAAAGFGAAGSDALEPAAPFFVRGAADLIPTAQLLNEHSPSLLCTLRNYAQVAPRVAGALGGNGYSLSSVSGGGVTGTENPYVYPDNLPRLNARGGPGGKPGCWQPITRELWPAPYLVMDTGASIAPYNHLELGQPLYVEHVWGRQVGENTINP